MTITEIRELAKQKRKMMNHPKANGSCYVILGIGKMDDSVFGWVESCTYMDVKTKESFTKPISDMGSFTERK